MSHISGGKKTSGADDDKLNGGCCSMPPDDTLKFRPVAAIAEGTVGAECSPDTN
jgi:hypothetical protein